MKTPMQYKYLIALISLLLSTSQVIAAEQETDAPDNELLDYLGQWQQVDGEWIDPMQLQEISMLEQDSRNGEQNEK